MSVYKFFLVLNSLYDMFLKSFFPQALLMLLVTSGFGQGQYLSITNENPEDNGSNKIIRTTRIRKNGQIDVVFKSRFITDDRSSGGSLSNLNKSGGIIDEIQEGVDERSRGLPPPI